MSTVENAPGWITFDCYGTLIDWRRGMQNALATVAPAHVDALIEAYHRHEPDLEGSYPVPNYRTVLTEGLSRAAVDVGAHLPAENADVLAQSLPRWPAFPETASVLRALKDAGWRLGILSNVDDDMVTQTVRDLGVAVDLVITAEAVGSYKPAPGHFETFQSTAQPAPSSWLHVACSWFHDIEPCLAMGTPTVFINRENEVRDTTVVVASLSDLHGLPEIAHTWSLAQSRK